ncbi:MAG: YcaO-like family protein [Bdellovibrionales bacterium]|nr:YcaO-like family protein [Bdellovibrionales bacterium]
MELLAQYPNHQLLNLKPTAGRENPPELYHESSRNLVDRLAQQIGVTRISQIDGFSHRAVATTQAFRPNLWAHYVLGLNTSGQGKSTQLEGSIAGAVMEVAEIFSAEERCPSLLRSTYLNLRKTAACVSPSKFIGRFRGIHRNLDNLPLMWTPTLHWFLETEVLVPAELVYAAFVPSLYNTKSVVVTSTAGLGAGFSLRDAATKALYEAYEHHLRSLFYNACAIVQAVQPPKVGCDFDLTVLLITSPLEKRPHPLIHVILDSQGRKFTGWGLEWNFDQSFHRAYTEAYQALVTGIAGAREDLRLPKLRTPKLTKAFLKKFEKMLPDEITLTEEQAHRLYPKPPADVFNGLITNLKTNGYRNLFFANLSRVGVEAKVVRCLSPDFRSSLAPVPLSSPLNSTTHRDLVKWKYLICSNKAQ